MWDPECNNRPHFTLQPYSPANRIPSLVGMGPISGFARDRLTVVPHCCDLRFSNRPAFLPHPFQKQRPNSERLLHRIHGHCCCASPRRIMYALFGSMILPCSHPGGDGRMKPMRRVSLPAVVRKKSAVSREFESLPKVWGRISSYSV